jgi:hypothetical protein
MTFLVAQAVDIESYYEHGHQSEHYEPVRRKGGPRTLVIF